MFKRVKENFKKYSRPFWVLMLATFIDNFGGAMLWPFFSLFFIDKYSITMIEVGYVFSLFSIGMLAGSTVGGAIADKFGRKPILLFGIFASGLSSLFFIFIEALPLLYVLSLIMGVLGSLGQPAQNAMTADLLPPELQTDGFGIFRIVMNITVVIAPLIGGILAAYSYNWLFIADAVASTITGIIVIFAIPETKPESTDAQKKESFGKTLRGYGQVLRDGLFMFFVLLGAIISLVYMQMNSTLSVFLNQQYSFTLQEFSYLLAMNAIMVVFLQFPITRIVSKGPPMIMAALGALLYAIGFGMYGFISGRPMFYIAMVIITIGEMVISPVAQTITVRLASKDKLGRYMAVNGISWMVPSLFAIILAGLVMERMNPNWIWYFGGILMLVATVGYLLLRKMSSKRLGEIDKEVHGPIIEEIPDEPQIE
ncbi:MAG: MDR family MFS transporter [Promethearchaeota archaeon]